MLDLAPDPLTASAAPSNAALDIRALRSLAAIQDCGGFHRAAAALHLSQSAVSQHVRKLERVVDRRLVVRDGRGTRFTADGEALLHAARRILAVHDDALAQFAPTDLSPATISVGSTEHAADQLLPAVTDQLRERFPGSSFRFRLDRSGRLNEALDRGSVDVAIFVGTPSAAGSVRAGALPFAWYAAPGWERPAASQPVPLVVIDEPCTIRRRALATLTAGGLQPTVAVEASNVGGVVNAARAGLGLALLAELGQPTEGLVRRNDLPAVEPERLHVRARQGSDPDLARLAAQAVDQLIGAAA